MNFLGLLGSFVANLFLGLWDRVSRRRDLLRAEEMTARAASLERRLRAGREAEEEDAKLAEETRATLNRLKAEADTRRKEVEDAGDDAEKLAEKTLDYFNRRPGRGVRRDKTE